MTASDAKTSPGPGRPKDDALAVRRRDEILRHAVAHFARDGYFDADLDAVAADVGCAKGTLYRYFDSKADLFHAAVDLVMRELLRATSAHDSDDVLEQLEFAIRAYLAYFDAHPEYVELLIQERAAFRDRQKPTYFVHRDASIERWTARHLSLMDQGRMRRIPVQRVHDVIGDLLYGTIFTNYFAGRRKTLDQQVTDVLDVLFNGLLTEDEKRKWEIRNPKHEIRNKSK
jgi:AcrR family transcriptional regulator